MLLQNSLGLSSRDTVAISGRKGYRISIINTNTYVKIAELTERWQREGFSYTPTV